MSAVDTDRELALMTVALSGPVGRETRCRPRRPPETMVAGPATLMWVAVPLTGSAETVSTPDEPMVRLLALIAVGLSSSSVPLLMFRLSTPVDSSRPV